jgi:hypothetical protein
MRTLANLQADLAMALALGLPKNLRHEGHEITSEGAEIRLRTGLVITITHENARRFSQLLQEG